MRIIIFCTKVLNIWTLCAICYLIVTTIYTNIQSKLNFEESIIIRVDIAQKTTNLETIEEKKKIKRFRRKHSFLPS